MSREQLFAAVTLFDGLMTADELASLRRSASARSRQPLEELLRGALSPTAWAQLVDHLESLLAEHEQDAARAMLALEEQLSSTLAPGSLALDDTVAPRSPALDDTVAPRSPALDDTVAPRSPALDDTVAPLCMQHDVTLASGAGLAGQRSESASSADSLSMSETLSPEDVGHARPVSADPADSDVTPESAGRYRLISEQGRGGIGRVMLALDTHVGRQVAIKELLIDSSDDPAHRSGTPGRSVTRGMNVRFLREARVTGQLEHPSIVPVYEIGQRPDGTLYYVMRMIKGRTLASAIRAAKSVRERLQLLTHFHDLCNAIAYAHSHDVIHRDIKPANVMIGGFGETIVLDWGLAKVKGEQGWDEQGQGERKLESGRDLQGAVDDSKTVAGQFLGTPAYMSPEQARGELGQIDEQTDIYALGAVLNEILTGAPPFRAKSLLVLLRQVEEEEPRPPIEVEPSVPRELSAVVIKALQKDKRKRYATAGRLADEIRNYLSGEKVAAYEYSSWELVKRFVARNKTLSAAALLGMVLIVASAGFIYQAYRRAERARAAARTEQVKARYHLGVALLETANKMHADKRHVAASIYAAASLYNNPAYPGSPYHTAGFLRTQPQALRRSIRAISKIAQIRADALAVPTARIASLHKVYSLSIAPPDGRLIASAGADRKVRLWALDKPAPIATFTGHQERVWAVTFSPDGRQVASGALDGTVRVWDVRRRRWIRTLAAHRGGVLCVAFSPDGRVLASGGWDKTVKLWDARQGTLLRTLTGHREPVRACTFTPDGLHVVSGSDDTTIRIWDAATGAGIHLLQGHRGMVAGVSVSPDGRFLASSSYDHSVRLWKMADGTPHRVLTGHTSTVRSVAFNPRGTTLATASYDKTVRLWHGQTGAPLAVLDGHADSVRAVAFSPDGHWLYSGGSDRTIRRWKVRSAEERRAFVGHRKLVTGVDVTRALRRLVSASEDGTVRLWDVATGRLRTVLRGHSGAVSSVALTPDGSLLASGGVDKTVRLWDVESGALRVVLREHKGEVTSLAFAPDGRRLASAGWDNTLRLWEMPEGKLLATFTGHRDRVWDVAFSADGRQLASGSSDKTVRLWDVATRRVIRVLRNPDIVYSVQYSSDGAYLATAGRDRRITLWRLSDYRRLAVLSGHTAHVRAVELSPDVRWIASASDDEQVIVWSLASRRERYILDVNTKTALKWQPDGRGIVVGSGRNVRIYRLDPAIHRADPQALLRAAERRAGLRLNGFLLEQSR
ncbi:MAG: protein kinase [bacterium]